ncbi:MAG: hypothetical protein MZV63_64900 [Marinilabiliales bacterium]|nr:hypothetical protein [Marinilabiliales bacterium]
MGDAPAKVLQEVLEVEAKLKKAEEEETVQKLVAELERGGLAASGLRDTIHRLNQFEVQTLVVTHNFSKPGRICPTHRILYLDRPQVPDLTTRKRRSSRTWSTRPSRPSSSAAGVRHIDAAVEARPLRRDRSLLEVHDPENEKAGPRAGARPCFVRRRPSSASSRAALFSLNRILLTTL